MFIAGLSLLAAHSSRSADWVVYEGNEGPGKGKHIVFVTGDEEYRSEEAMPMLAKILAVRHGFQCTVLFSINPATGMIDPNNQTNIVGLEHLQDADMMVLFTRFREPPDEQMKYVADVLNSGKPIFGIRTATHAFSFDRNKKSAYARYDWRSREWPGGFGQQVFGDTWISHHGDHGRESTRGIVHEQFKDHPILRGVEDIWGPTDVYGIKNLPRDAKVLVYGQVLEGMKPSDKPVSGRKNDPMMPLIWIREYNGESGRTSRIITSTIGAATDLESEGLRRLFVNACYWGLGLEEKIPARSDVAFVGEYNPTPFGFNKYQRGVKPADHELASASDPRARATEPFNGKNLEGWTTKEPKSRSHWAVGKAELNPANRKELTVSQPGNELVNPKAGGVDIYTLEKYGDSRIEAEVMVPEGSNSGIYVMGEYEIQVFDSYGKEKLGGGDMGAIYGAAPPAVNASKAPGEWQKYVIEFRAPKFDEQGKKTSNARFLSVRLNGQVLHRDVEMKGPTPSGITGKEAAKGPLMFQGDHGPVAYRNIRISPLE
jgi:hypothetical protein